ncbi:unnamed protein product [Moneuplotes crassus]|uniref:Uncharacterized protein n=1 Tax=Euplotes crassus TaxID=5936 RepID=A0AAD2D5P9_EUPCR|nr:unnamed protein product [Moneuplotes crassus]
MQAFISKLRPSNPALHRSRAGFCRTNKSAEAEKSSLGGLKVGRRLKSYGFLYGISLLLYLKVSEVSVKNKNEAFKLRCKLPNNLYSYILNLERHKQIKKNFEYGDLSLDQLEDLKDFSQKRINAISELCNPYLNLAVVVSPLAMFCHWRFFRNLYGKMPLGPRRVLFLFQFLYIFTFFDRYDSWVLTSMYTNEVIKNCEEEMKKRA